MRIRVYGCFLGLAMILSLACSDGLSAQSDSGKEGRVRTVQDARIYREAMVWFKKAEALIGTPKENSDEQAELFQKAIQIMPDFVEVPAWL